MGKNESSKIKRTPIREAVKLRLWGMAAGRCEICNKLLYLDSHYGDDANFSENAHIHAVGKTGPRHADDMTQDEINNIDNLMLLCAEHHHLIDTKPENYLSDFLIVQKKAHEDRIRRLTEIQDADSCKVVTFFSNIDNVDVFNAASVLRRATVKCGFYPKQDDPIELHNGSVTKYIPSKDIFQLQASELENQVKQYFGSIVKKEDVVALFALAPQPLLFKLGCLLCDQLNVRVFQCHREGDKWAWPDDQSTVDFQIHQSKADSETAVALVIDLSAEIIDQRIENTLGERCSIYHLTIPAPNRVFVKHPQIQDSFVRTFRLAMERIKNDNPKAKEICLFPAMPASLAVRAGMDIMPKVDLPVKIYDQLSQKNSFEETITIGG